jgi:hypothetical protein
MVDILQCPRKGPEKSSVRIRIVQQTAVSSIGGIRLDKFVPGTTYNLGTLGSLFLAEGWAIPIAPNDPHDAGVLLRYMDKKDLPPNLIIERSPPSREWLTPRARLIQAKILRKAPQDYR